MGLRAAIMLGTYNAVSRVGWSGLLALTRTGLVGRKWRLHERTGNYDAVESESAGPGVWIHAASVGEVKAAGALAKALARHLSGPRILLSVLTTTGVDSARDKTPEVDAIVQAPVDLRGPLRNAFSRFNPSLLLLVETEIWPNMILESAMRGTAVAIVSAKITAGSFRRYKLVRPLMDHVLSAVACVCAQSEADRERFCSLGLDPAKVRVTGDIKLDAELPEQHKPAPAWLPEILGEKHGWLFCAGSTRPGEEETLGRAVLMAAGRLGDGLTTVIAPRHVARGESVCDGLKRLGLTVALKSRFSGDGWRGSGGPRVLVLDTMGELGAIYAACELAFVGGTLAPFGGHNLAEPAALGVPVLFGPHVEKTQEVAQSLVVSGGGLTVSTAEELAARLADLLIDVKERSRRGQAARAAVKSLQGATNRTLQFLEELSVLPCRR